MPESKKKTASKPKPAVAALGDGLAVEIGRRLIEAREGLRWTQEVAALRSKGADPSGEGISRSTLSLYETGVNQPGARALIVLSETLRVTPNWLLYGSDSPAKTLQASLEYLRGSDLDVAVRLVFAMLALEPEERDSYASLIFASLSKKLGDLRLSGLIVMADLCRPNVLKQIVELVGEENAKRPIKELIPLFAKKAAESGWTTTGTLRPGFTEEQLESGDFDADNPPPPRKLTQRK